MAPIVARTASSRVRPEERASNRLPTFAHAISSTNPTAASSMVRIGRTEPTICCLSGTMLAVIP